ncbi:MAG: hypothetical protein Q4A28_05955 [Brachymonas sp.]|nr:hypothetical protein [Brachymonas sp.]
MAWLFKGSKLPLQSPVRMLRAPMKKRPGVDWNGGAFEEALGVLTF